MSADKIEKFFKALFIVKDKVEIVTEGLVETEEDFNKILWKQSDGSFSSDNPHSELTWTKVKEEMDKL